MQQPGTSKLPLTRMPHSKTRRRNQQRFAVLAWRSFPRMHDLHAVKARQQPTQQCTPDGFDWNHARYEIEKHKSALDKAAHVNCPRTLRYRASLSGVRGVSSRCFSQSLQISSSFGGVSFGFNFSCQLSMIPVMCASLTPDLT